MKEHKPTVEVSRSFDGKHVIHYNEASHRYKMDGEAVAGTTTVIESGSPTAYNLIQWMKGQAIESLWNALYERGTGTEEVYFSKLSRGISKEEKDSIFKDAKNASEEKKKDAGAMGTLVHDFCHLTELKKADEAEALLEKISKLPKESSVQIMNSINKFKEFKKTDHSSFEMAETLVGAPSLGLCGKFDLLSRKDGLLVLSDYKTAKSYYLKQFIQLALYRRQIKEWLGLDVSALRVLLFNKEDGDFKEPLTISDPNEMKMFEDAGIRCLETWKFLKFENDPRFNWKK